MKIVSQICLFPCKNCQNLSIKTLLLGNQMILTVDLWKSHMWLQKDFDSNILRLLHKVLCSYWPKKINLALPAASNRANWVSRNGTLRPCAKGKSKYQFPKASNTNNNKLQKYKCTMKTEADKIRLFWSEISSHPQLTKVLGNHSQHKLCHLESNVL